MDFTKAIEVAQANLKQLQQDAEAVKLEAALINDNTNRYEISLSYRLKDKDLLSLSDKQDSIALMMRLANLNRTYKTFLIDAKTYEFKGFKEYKEV